MCLLVVNIIFYLTLLNIFGIDIRMRKLTLMSISELRESKENKLLYDPPSYSDIEALAESIKKRGLLHHPVITEDNVIISGHRRILAHLHLGRKSIRCRIEPITYHKNTEKFLKLLREANRQRVKKINEVIHEEVVDSSSNKERLYNLELNRIKSSEIDVEEMEIVGEKRRFQIKGNKPLLDAAIKIINELHDYWPLSVRQIHYKLLNDPPLKNKNDPTSVYRNDPASYHTLTNVLTRGRLFGLIPWEAIGDETRPFVSWSVYDNTSPFIENQFDGFMKGYHRNFLQSQPNWIEIMAEKLTLGSIIRPIAVKYHIPYTIGRGYSSINPRHDLAVRFGGSGKEKLVILILSDLDPDGDEIAQSFARSMRDDFDVDSIYPIKVALIWEQIKDLQLPESPDRKAKSGSTNFNKYVEKYKSNDVWELEALEPQQLQKMLDETVRGVLDIDLFNQEMQNEKSECVELDKYREQVFKAIQQRKEVNPNP
jgi:hypothetical protein